MSSPDDLYKVMLEVPFAGSPADFATVVEHWTHTLLHSDSELYGRIRAPIANSVAADARSVTVLLRTGNRYGGEACAIVGPSAVSDKRKSVISVSARLSLWPEVEALWKIMFDELVRLGWCHPSNEEEPHRGRPSNKDYDWAYDQVRVKGRPYDEVKREWLETPAAKKLETPGKSFDNAFNARDDKVGKKR